MARTKKYNEKYIRLKKSSSTNEEVSFQVYIRDERIEGGKYLATFPFAEYGSKEVAFQAAIQERDRIIKTIEAYGAAANSSITFREAFEHMLTFNTLKDMTIRNYRADYNAHLDAKLGDMLIRKITPQKMRQVMAEFAEECTPNTLRKLRTLLNQIFKCAVYSDFLDANVMDKVGKTKSKRPPQFTRHIELRLSDFLEFKDKYLSVTRFYKDDSIERHRTIVLALELIYYTGLRPAECFALHKSDFNFKEGIITSNYALNYADPYNIKREAPKSKQGVRVVPLPTQLTKQLKDHFASNDYPDAFVKEDGTFFNIDRVSGRVNAFCRARDLKFNMYQLRHNFATNLVTNNVDTRTIQELMGHANIQMSIYYARSNEDLKKEAVKTIPSLPS